MDAEAREKSTRMKGGTRENDGVQCLLDDARESEGQ